MKTWIFKCSTALISLGFAASVQAQEAAPAQADTGADGRLEEIVVTAQRRAENLQKVPIAVTALNSDQLKASGIANTRDLTAVVPGLVVGDQAGLVQPAIRGVTTTSGGAGIENSVATYIDGVYIASIPGSLVNLGDTERVEVLRGPQGTLFGRNATGGLINVITKDPGREPTGDFTIGYGNYETLTGSMYLSLPVTENLGASIAFNGTHMGDGYGTNLNTGRDTNKIKRDISLRNKWMLDLGATKARLSFDYSNQNSSFTLVDAFRDRPIFYGTKREGSAWDIDQTIDPYHALKSAGVNLRVEHDLGALDVVSISSYRGMNFLQFFDFDTGPLPAVTIRYQNNDRQFSQELQLQKSSGQFKWVIGGFFFHSTSRFTPYVQSRDTPLAKGSTVIDSRISADSLAAFGQGSYTLDSGTEFTVGLRYTTEKRGVTGQQETFGAAGQSLGLSYAPVDASKRFNKLTWRLAVSQQLGNSSMLYASYNRGFKAGSFNGQAPNLPAFNPEVLDAYELGLKTDLLDRRLRVNVAGFYYDYKDIQVRTFVNGTSRIYNGAKSRQYGVDIDLTAALSNRLTLSSAIELMHHRFVSFDSAVLSTPQPNGSNVLAPGSAKGNRLPFASDWTASIGAHYKLPISNGNVTFNGDYTYNDGYFSEPDNVLRQPKFGMWNGSIVWNSDAGYSLSVWGKNLTNTKVLSLIATTPTSTLAAYQAPRTYGATLGYKF